MSRILRNSHMRTASYSKRKVYLRNASTFGFGKYEAIPGDLISFSYPTNNGEPSEKTHFGRVMGRVDASRESDTIPAVKGHLTVLVLNDTATHASLRWVDPTWVRECRTVPSTLARFFFSPDLPSLDVLMKLDDLGAMADHYIGKYLPCCEACILAHGLFADERCTHKDGAP
jgi:hypothetical protein